MSQRQASHANRSVGRRRSVLTARPASVTFGNHQQQQPGQQQPDQQQTDQWFDGRAFLPSALRGSGSDAIDREIGRRALELDAHQVRSSPDADTEGVPELDNLLSTSDNAVVCFMKPGCPYCEMFEPIYDGLARDIHRTNLTAPVYESTQTKPVPIVLARINGSRHREAINSLRPGFLGDPKFRRGYPTLLFHRGSDHVGITWDPETPRDPTALLAFMADFFGDPQLRPIATASALDRAGLLSNRDATAVVMTSDSNNVVPRFVRPLDPSYVNTHDAVDTINFLLLSDPALARSVLVLPVNRIDRPDVPLPDVVTIDPSTRQPAADYGHRDAVRWFVQSLANRPSSLPSSSSLSALHMHQDDGLYDDNDDDAYDDDVDVDYDSVGVVQ